MRECVYKAELISDKVLKSCNLLRNVSIIYNLIFQKSQTRHPLITTFNSIAEAAAIYYKDYLGEHDVNLL